MSIDLVLDRSTLAPGGIDAKRLGCHTAVLAQSGSGKSFMVGRLIEEILLKVRVIVLDSNSDSVPLWEPSPKPWTIPSWKPLFFPGEAAETLESRWKLVHTVVLSTLADKELTHAKRYSP